MKELMFSGPTTDTLFFKKYFFIIFLALSMMLFLFLPWPLQTYGSVVLAVIFIVIYFIIWKLSKIYGELEDDAFQIIIGEKEINSIAPSRGPVTINADEILDLKFSRQKGGLIKFKLKDYRRFGDMGLIEYSMMPYYQKNRPWMGFPVPFLPKEERKKLIKEVEIFKKRNHIGIENQR